MAKLRKGYEKFHAFLKRHQAGARVSSAQILRATGWTESTLTTYLRKNKLSAFLLKLPDGLFEVLMNGDAVTEADIQGALSQVTPEVMSLFSGERLIGQLSQYLLESRIGEGAVGHVWSGRNAEDNSRVAVKVVNPRPDLLEPSLLKNIEHRFAREAKHGLKLRHDCIVSVIDHGSYRRKPFLVMEPARQSVATILKSRGPLTIDVASKVVLRCAFGLKYLHDQGCVHRDVKPHNILDLDRGFVLGDLGIVKWSDMNRAFTSAGTITRASVQLGSWHYMAPEQQQNAHEAVAASDLYALGVTWYELLTGSTATPQLFAAQRQQKPSSNEKINKLVAAMTSFDVADRPTVDAIIRAIS